MAELREARPADLELFPGCTYVVDGSVPEAQCEETEIAIADGDMTDTLYTITKVGGFAGFDLAGKKVTVTAPIGEAGTFGIVSNTDDVITTDNQFGTTDAGGVAFTCHDTGQTYLTRNESSFERFIQEASKAHTRIGGVLFTDVAAGPMAGACSDTFAPV